MNLNQLLRSLLSLPTETEWVEFKHNNDNPEAIGEYLSALANSAALHGKEGGYLVWGVEDGTHKVLGTTVQPRVRRIGNEELENWLAHNLSPRVDFRFHESTMTTTVSYFFAFNRRWPRRFHSRVLNG